MIVSSERGGLQAAGGTAPAQLGRRRRAILLAAVIVIATSAAPAAAATADRERVVVTFRPGTPPAERAEVMASASAPVADLGTAVAAQSLADGAVPVVAEVTSGQRTALIADPRVVEVYDDVPVTADAPPAQAAAVVPDDPAWEDQDGVRRIRANEVWEQVTGDGGTVIAVVDTGVDRNNGDLRGRLTAGYDFVNDDTDPADDNGHGTAAATIAGAAGNDGTGVAGLCWRCRIMPVKVLDETGKGFLSDAALGIAWAVDHGADVINVSLGAPNTMPLLDEALDHAVAAGVLVVASAGNAGTTAPQWPAADPRAMGIAALDELERRADYSSHGTWVDAAAPGCNPSGWLDNAVVAFCGTSSSAPLVSGAAALLTSARGATPATAVRQALRRTAVPVGDGLGGGRIDALAALRNLPSFSDISGSVHADNIEKLADAGVTDGCGGGRYCPAQRITRGQIATFLDRAMDLPDGDATFADVPADHPHAVGIAAVASAGITEGCTSRRFCPGSHLTRAQMATLLDRALDLPAGPPRFDDVDDANVHAAGIWAIAAAEITTGCEPERFCPTATVTRAQMASFLVRAFDL